MLQDIAPHHLFNEYNKKRPFREDDYLMAFRDGKILLKQEIREGREWLSLPLCGDLAGESGELVYLLELDERAFFLWSLPQEECLLGEKDSWVWNSISSMRSFHPAEEAYGAVTAYHLAVWYRNNAFCGRCGLPMKRDTAERAMRCSCGNIVYPRISPGVIVRVTHGDKILLTRYAGREFTNYALIAGFTEIGETLEETVHREVMEEVGLRVKNVRYYKNQPWPFSQSLLVGFTAELDGEDETITLEEEELSTGVFMTREEMPARTGDISLTAEMMENFRLGKE